MNRNDRSFFSDLTLFSDAYILNRHLVLNSFNVKEFACFLEMLLVARMVLDGVVGTYLMRYVTAGRKS